MTTNILPEGYLNGREEKIYLAALELGSATANEIAKRAAIHRTSFYDVFQNLQRQGLLKQTKKGNRHVFTALPPHEFITRQEQRIAQLKSQLPQLEAIYNSAERLSRLFYFEGEGVYQIFDDLFSSQKEILMFYTPRFLDFTHKNQGKKMMGRRVQEQVPLRLIAEASKETMELQKHDNEMLRETRLLPYDLFHSDVEVGVCGQRFFVIDLKEKFGFVFENAGLANMMKQVFELIWRSGKIIS